MQGFENDQFETKSEKDNMQRHVKCKPQRGQFNANKFISIQ